MGRGVVDIIWGTVPPSLAGPARRRAIERERHVSCAFIDGSFKRRPHHSSPHIRVEDSTSLPYNIPFTLRI